MRSLMELFGWFERGELRPRIGATVPLDDAREALRMLTEPRAVGKVVVTMT